MYRMVVDSCSISVLGCEGSEVHVPCLSEKMCGPAWVVCMRRKVLTGQMAGVPGAQVAACGFGKLSSSLTASVQSIPQCGWRACETLSKTELGFVWPPHAAADTELFFCCCCAAQHVCRHTNRGLLHLEQLPEPLPAPAAGTALRSCCRRAFHTWNSCLIHCLPILQVPHCKAAADGGSAPAQAHPPPGGLPGLEQVPEPPAGPGTRPCGERDADEHPGGVQCVP